MSKVCTRCSPVVCLLTPVVSLFTRSGSAESLAGALDDSIVLDGPFVKGATGTLKPRVEAGEKPVSQKQLADHAATDPMMTSQVLRVLEQRGLVIRAGDPADARARAVSVAPAGFALANRAVTVVEDCDAAFFAALGADQPTLVRCLRTLARR